MKTIFTLSSIMLTSGCYPLRYTRKTPIGIYSTLKKAVAAMHLHITSDYASETLCFFITQKRFDENIYYSNVSIRSYTKDGELNDECLVDEGVDKNFFGRPKEKIRFKMGDIVEVIDSYHSELNIVGMPPPTPEQYDELEAHAAQRAKAKGQKPDFYMDITDDTYLLYSLGEGDTHGHTICPMIFMPTKKVSKALEQKLRNKLLEMSITD